MKQFTITAFGETHEVYIKLGKYADNGRTVIELLDANDHFPYAVASVNFPNVLLLDKEVIIKDYSENEGMFQFLCNNNIITDTGKTVNNGYVSCPIGRLNPELSWGEVPEVYSMETPEYTNQLDPIPDEVDLNTGKAMWQINGYRIWATSYREAVMHMELIETF